MLGHSLEFQMLCGLVNRVAQSEESDSGLRQRMETHFKERGDVTKFMTGIETTEDKVTGRIESHYPKRKVKEEGKPRKARVQRKFPLTEVALKVFNQMNAESAAQKEEHH